MVRWSKWTLFLQDNIAIDYKQSSPKKTLRVTQYAIILGGKEDFWRLEVHVYGGNYFWVEQS